MLLRFALFAFSVLLIPISTLGQEFERGSGGQIEALTKGVSSVSGSLGLSLSGAGEGYEATFGGSALDDRLWFFGSATALPGMSQQSTSQAIDAKLTAQLGDRNVLAASFSQVETPAAPMFPSSFLSLRYDATVSNSFFFSASFLSRR